MPFSDWSPWVLLPLAVLAFMTVVFVIAQLKKNNGIVDIAWGLVFILSALLSLFLYAMPSSHQLLMTAVVLLWGLRLSGHILIRNWGRPEDFRYAKWREEWKKQLGVFWVLRAYLQVFVLQGALSLLVVLPVLWVNLYGGGEINGVVCLGAAVWFIGFFFESVGDYQLSQFIKTKKKGEIMTKGLWRYTRHPNYFGEVTQWWGVWIMALAAPNAWITVVSPLLITFLILYVSGIPMLEKKYEDNLSFQDYKKRTSAFFPLPPKKTDS